MRAYLAVCAAGMMAAASPALAQISDWQISPYSAFVGNAVLSIGGRAAGAAISSDQPGTGGEFDAAGLVYLSPGLTRTYDTGLTVGLTTSILLYPDQLYTGRNGNDAFQYAFGHVETGLGSIEIGMTEGAASRLANKGPIPDLSFSDPSLSPFRDPVSNRAFMNIFTPRDYVFASANFSKISLYTPRLFGVELGLSFTPYQSKQIFPLLDKGAEGPDHQQNIWEFAASYSDDLDDVSGISFFGSFALGHNGDKTADHAGLTDWALGVSYDRDLGQDWRVTFSTAYHASNAYTFNLNNVLASGETDTVTASLAAETGSWAFGGEYVSGNADGIGAIPNLGLAGYQLFGSYELNTNVTFTASWQRLNYSRSAGTFYNGARHIGMNAGLLYLDFHI